MKTDQQHPSTTKMNTPRVALIMGSLSDRSVLQAAADQLDRLKIQYTWQIVSAHRSPEQMLQFASTAQNKGLKVIIAAAGGAAHLPGMVAAATTLPVIGIPIQSKNSMQGWDSLLSIAQMPTGVPVATMAVNGAENAALFAAKILALQDTTLATALKAHKQTLLDLVEQQNQQLKDPSS